jgi:3-hydroxyacyl-CoA dehydrogenase
LFHTNSHIFVVVVEKLELTRRVLHFYSLFMSDSKTQPTAKQSIAVIGSGIVGRSWCAIFARGGYNVRLFDIKSEQVDAAIAQVRDETLPRLHTLGLLKKQSVEDVLGRISPVDTLDAALDGAVYAQTCVPEVGHSQP